MKFLGNSKKNWSTLDHDEKHITKLMLEIPWMLERRKQVVSELTSILTRNNAAKMTRDDYRECAENTLLILGETPPRGVHFLKPGAIHQARWMSCNIYGTKMLMFASQMGYDSDMIEKLKRLNHFLALFYTPMWMPAVVSADAPLLDLTFIHSMIKYQTVNREIAYAVLKKMFNHRWYLTEEIVQFVLFSKHPTITKQMKEDIAAKLLITPVPEQFRLGKPVFRQINADTALSDLLGSESHLQFHLLKI